MAMKRDVRIAAWALALLLAGMWVKATLNWAAEPVVSVDYVVELNRLRYPVDIRQNEDGSIAFLKACKVMDGQNRAFGDRYLKFNNSNDEQWFGLLWPYWPGDMNSTDRGNLRAWLADNDQVFRMAEYAMSRKYCRFHLYSRDGDLGYVDTYKDLFGARELREAFFWRAKMKAADGDVAGAIHDVLLVSGMSRNFVNYPYMSEWYIGKGMVEGGCWAGLEIASRANLTGGQLAELAAGLESSGKAYYSIGTALEYNRFLIHDMVQRSFSDDGHGNGRFLAGHSYRRIVEDKKRYYHSVGDKLRLKLSVLGDAYATEDRKTTLARWDKAVDKAIRLSELPLWELDGKYAADVSSLKTDLEHNSITVMLDIGLKEYIHEPQKTRNIVEGTLATLAVLRYKTEKGRLPDGLDEVVKAGLLKEMPLDRYSGKPFVYEKTVKGFKLYSVGETIKDDGTSGRGPITFWPADGYYRGYPAPAMDDQDINRSFMEGFSMHRNAAKHNDDPNK
jgi:hypothetical protein